MSSKKRYRIHPAVACVAMVVVAALAIAAQHFGENASWKIFAAGIICFILGVKVRVKLPIT